MIDAKYQKYLTEGEDGLFAILSDTPEKIKKQLEDYDAEYYKMYGVHIIETSEEEDEE